MDNVFATRAEARASGQRGAKYRGTPCGTCGGTARFADGNCAVRGQHPDQMEKNRLYYGGSQRARSRRHYEKGREAIIARVLKRYRENREALIAAQREWQRANPAKVKANDLKRAERTTFATPRDLSTDDWAMMDAMYFQRDCVNAFLADPIPELPPPTVKTWHVHHLVPLAAKLACGTRLTNHPVYYWLGRFLHSPMNLQPLEGFENLSQSNNCTLDDIHDLVDRLARWTNGTPCYEIQDHL